MKNVSLKNTIYITDKLLERMKQMSDETRPDRFLALYDLTRKMRACMDALIPISKYDSLCVPVNLLYRCIASDLMTSLLFAMIDDEAFKKVTHIMDMDYARSFIKALNADLTVKKSLCPDNKDAYDNVSLAYQNRHYDDFSDCLKFNNGEVWELKKKESIKINGVDFNGTVDKMYDVLLSFDEVRDIACIYEYYKIFSQSEHFSLKNRVFIYKQDFHERYYNTTRGLIYLGEEYIYKKYTT